MKISVIMPSYLGEYPGCAPHRKQMFVRAVDSFLTQTHKDAELVCCSDGCLDTIQILERSFKKELLNGRILLLKLFRHELFTGIVRQEAIDAATGDILCNLDTDDYFRPYHLNAIAASFGNSDWVYMNHYIVPHNLRGIEQLFMTDGTLERMNNASIAWRRSLPVSWVGADGRQDNKIFLARLLESPNRKKIHGAGYVCTNVSTTVTPINK